MVDLRFQKHGCAKVKKYNKRRTLRRRMPEGTTSQRKSCAYRNHPSCLIRWRVIIPPHRLIKAGSNQVINQVTTSWDRREYFIVEYITVTNYHFYLYSPSLQRIIYKKKHVITHVVHHLIVCNQKTWLYPQTGVLLRMEAGKSKSLVT